MGRVHHRDACGTRGFGRLCGRPFDAYHRTPLTGRIRVLTIGHSYVVAENRALVREVARDSQLDVTVVAPVAFDSGLGRIELQPEPSDSNLTLKALSARFTR